MRHASFFFLTGFLLFCTRKPENVFSFCRDFNPDGCINPVADRVAYPLEKSIRDKTVRDFANSIYFRGDRLAFEIKNAHSKYDVTFECLHGRYFFGSDLQAHELEYVELRERNVYGLVMLGSLIEKKYASLKQLPYRALEPFEVSYTISCGKDVLVKHKIVVELQ
jgi:hypothetical protein